MSSSAVLHTFSSLAQRKSMLQKVDVHSLTVIKASGLSLILFRATLGYDCRAARFFSTWQTNFLAAILKQSRPQVLFQLCPLGLLGIFQNGG